MTGTLRCAWTTAIGWRPYHVQDPYQTENMFPNTKIVLGPGVLSLYFITNLESFQANKNITVQLSKYHAQPDMAKD